MIYDQNIFYEVRTLRNTLAIYCRALNRRYVIYYLIEHNIKPNGVFICHVIAMSKVVVSRIL